MINEINLGELLEEEKFDEVRSAIENGADTSCMVGWMEDTPLIVECSELGQLEIVQLIIAKKGDSQEILHKAFLKAAYGGHLDIVELLVNNGANADFNEGLVVAALDGHLNVIKYCLSKGADINHQEPITVESMDVIETMSNTAIMECNFTVGFEDDDDTKKRKIQTIDYLLKNGADVNAKGRFGNTALHFAANDYNLEIIKLLLDAGADKKAKNDNGKTPITYADKEYKKAKALLKI